MAEFKILHPHKAIRFWDTHLSVQIESFDFILVSHAGVLTGVNSTSLNLEIIQTPCPSRLPSTWLSFDNPANLNAEPSAMTFLVARVARTRWILHNAPRAGQNMVASTNLTNCFSTCCRCWQRADKARETEET